jgi:hypothetical protein
LGAKLGQMPVSIGTPATPTTKEATDGH